MKREPGACPDEGALADIGGGKSFCGPWGMWTNCREVGHCVFEDLKKPGGSQLSIFELLVDWSDGNDFSDCER